LDSLEDRAIPLADVPENGSPLDEGVAAAAYTGVRKNLSLTSCAGSGGVTPDTVSGWKRKGKEIADLLADGGYQLEQFSIHRRNCYKFYINYQRGRADRAEQLVDTLDAIDKPTAKWTLHQLETLDENFRPAAKRSEVEVVITTRDDIIKALQAVMSLGGEAPAVIDGKATRLLPDGED
jgi:hypothetical protein